MATLIIKTPKGMNQINQTYTSINIGAVEVVIEANYGETDQVAIRIYPTGISNSAGNDIHRILLNQTATD